MPVLTYLWIIPLLPLLGAAANGIFGGRWPKRIISAVALSSTTLSFLVALEAVREFFTLSPNQIPWIRTYFTWISAGGFQADFALQVDQLTVIMLLVVTGVGWLIHIYSTGYMHEDPGYRRFFSYLNLFMFFMLVLILAANYLLMFVGWEGVGLSSYLLIGFFFLKQSATNAGNKAFWVNRIGDFGFLLGLFLIFRTFGSLDFSIVLPRAAGMAADPAGQIGTLTTIALLLFVGAVGKSAQLPLYVWLPDAMEGPTPVSALIHAATMVTAGVYMVVRSHAIFLNAPVAMQVVGVIGCATALFAATIGLVQTDIKKVLAYSTVSQLGYMFLACGVGAFGAGIFHLMTHAFFKGLLFLAAGSVIHAMGGEQDMRKMGGLRKKIPVTFWTMFMATLAIAGAPGFSGFFSKDEILNEAQHVSPVLWGLGVLTAGLTSFYMFRLLFLTFFGAERYDEHHVHVHESPKNMTIPLIVLAVLSVCGGWMAAPQLVGGVNHFQQFLAPVLATGGGTGCRRGRIFWRRRRNFAGPAWRARDRRTARFLPGVVVLYQEPGSAEEAGGFAFPAVQTFLRKIFCRRVVSGRDRAPAGLDFRQSFVARDRRACHRRRRERRRLRFPRNGRPRATRDDRKHSQLRHLDRPGRARFHFPAALDGGLTCSKLTCFRF